MIDFFFGDPVSVFISSIGAYFVVEILLCRLVRKLTEATLNQRYRTAKQIMKQEVADAQKNVKE